MIWTSKGWIASILIYSVLTSLSNTEWKKVSSNSDGIFAQFVQRKAWINRDVSWNSWCRDKCKRVSYCALDGNTEASAGFGAGVGEKGQRGWLGPGTWLHPTGNPVASLFLTINIHIIPKVQHYTFFFSASAKCYIWSRKPLLKTDSILHFGK